MARPGEKEDNHNYDDAGMPLGTTYADYDNGEEVKAHMVKDKPVKHPINEVFDTEYQGVQLTKKFTSVTPLSKKNFNSAMADGVGFPEVEPSQADTAITDYSVQGRGGTDEYERKLAGDTSEVTTPFNPESDDLSFLDEVPEEKKKEDKKDA